MPEQTELPTFFAHATTAYNVLPDDAPMTWSIWDREGCIGDIAVADGVWSAAHNLTAARFGAFASWQESIVGLLHGRPPQPG